jgi:hypothetical protein
MTKVLLLFVTAVPSMLAAAEAGPGINLQVLERVTVSNQYARIIEGPFKCDSDGSVFVSPYEGGGFSTNLVKIEDRGRRVTKFPAALPPGLEKGGIADFAIGRNKEVYLLMGNGKGDIFILSLDRDGKPGSTAKLDLNGMGPAQLAAFDTGDFLLSGRMIEDHQLGRPYIAIFNGRGQLQKTVNPKGDVKADSPEVVRLGKAEQGGIDGYTLALGATVERGDDGNVYIARGTASGPIFVVSPAGTVVRTIRITPPSSNARFVSLKIASGHLAVQFSESDPKTTETAAVTILLLDARSGRELARYSHKSAEIGAAFACYMPPDEFVFVGADKGGKMQLVRAGPER